MFKLKKRSCRANRPDSLRVGEIKRNIKLDYFHFDHIKLIKVRKPNKDELNEVKILFR